MTVFRKAGDYVAFLATLRQTQDAIGMRLLGYCLMPNHFHLVLWPRQDGDLSAYVRRLLTTHVRRYHIQYQSSGHVWQGRFKAFPIQDDGHVGTVVRYAERNPLRAKLVRRAENWRWSSVSADRDGHPTLTAGPLRRGPRWIESVNKPQTEAEVSRLRECIVRGRPFGSEAWQTYTATKLGLEASLNPRGRPRKQVAEDE